MTQSNINEAVHPALRAVVGLALLGLAGAVVWSISTMPVTRGGLADSVFARLDESGVGNPVTAVLLNFRGYDTMLEVGVLTLDLVAIWSLIGGAGGRMPTSTGRMLNVVDALLAPVMIVVGGYLLWVGADEPGGAFQAGAVLSATGILLLLVERDAIGAKPFNLRAGVGLGLFAFALVGCCGLVVTGSFLAYPDGWSKPLILVVEVASTISIGLILLGVFAVTPRRLTRSTGRGDKG